MKTVIRSIGASIFLKIKVKVKNKNIKICFGKKYLIIRKTKTFKNKYYIVDIVNNKVL